MKQPIWFVAGSKGGVGKSAIALLLVDYARGHLNACVHVIDTDPTNPDVARPYVTKPDGTQPDDGVSIGTIPARDTQGWIDVLEEAEAHPERVVVINGSAGDFESLREARHVFDAVAEIERELVVWWVVGRDKESVVLLSRYVDLMGTATADRRRTFIVLNPGLSNERRFRDYTESRLATELEAQGCPVVRPGYLAEDVAIQIRGEAKTIDAGRDTLPTFRAKEVARWARVSHQAFAEALDDG